MDTFPRTNIRILLDQIGKLVPGQVAVVRNASIEMLKGFMRLKIDQWGKISSHPDGIASTPAAPTEICTKKNMSEVEYELVTME